MAQPRVSLGVIWLSWAQSRGDMAQPRLSMAQPRLSLGGIWLSLAQSRLSVAQPRLLSLAKPIIPQGSIMSKLDEKMSSL